MEWGKRCVVSAGSEGDPRPVRIFAACCYDIIHTLAQLNNKFATRSNTKDSCKILLLTTQLYYPRSKSSNPENNMPIAMLVCRTMNELL